MSRELVVYNSLTRQKEVFSPLQEGYIGMYVCGPTVYSDVHLGNCRTFVSFDMIYRYLMHLGYKVRYVRNITDVGHMLDDGEDRMSKGARLDNLEPMEVAQKYTLGFHDMMRIFNTLSPSIEPRATEKVTEVQYQPIREEITYDDFAKLDIRTATIIHAEKIEKADKLLKLTLDLGFEKRTVVSGIAAYYTPEQVIGQRVSLLANLAPRKMRGVESQGMILMAENGEGKLSFVSPAADWQNGQCIK